MQFSVLVSCCAIFAGVHAQFSNPFQLVGQNLGGSLCVEHYTAYCQAVKASCETTTFLKVVCPVTCGYCRGSRQQSTLPPPVPYTRYTPFYVPTTTRKPRPTTTKTPATTRRPPTDLCSYGKWSKCTLETTHQTRSSRYCGTKSRECKVGAVMADLFIENLLQASANKVTTITSTGGGSQESAGGGGSSGGTGSSAGTGGSAGARPSGGTGSSAGGSAGGAAINPVDTSGRFFPLPAFPAGGGFQQFLPSFITTTKPPTTTTKPPEKKCVEIYSPFDSTQLLAGNCNRGRYTLPTRSKRAPESYQTKRDLVFMLDESGSVGKARFEKVKRIAAAIVKVLCGNAKYARHYTHIAVISFDKKVHAHISLNDFYLTPSQLATRISNILYDRFSAGRTCMSKALKHVYDDELQQSYRIGYPDVEQDIILITDGCANCPSRYGRTVEQNIQGWADTLLENNIHVYVIGIGLRKNCKNILKILAQGGRCYHFFYLDKWDFDVDSFIYQLEHPPQNRCIHTFEHPSGQCL